MDFPAGKATRFGKENQRGRRWEKENEMKKKEKIANAAGRGCEASPLSSGYLTSLLAETTNTGTQSL